jgi:hypothetical protein
VSNYKTDKEKTDVVAPLSKGAFPSSHFCNKLDDKLARKVAYMSL